jgi:protein SCO1/2
VTAEPGVRRFLLTAVVCLVLGVLGAVLVALVREPETGLAETFRPQPVPPPEFRLRDHEGRPASPADARGQVLALTFAFAQCRETCPAIGRTIGAAVAKAGPGVQVMVVSVDPENDTPENVRRFLRRNGLEGGLRYLVGTREELLPVWQQYGIVPIATGREDDYEPKQPDEYVPFETPPAADDPYPAADDLQYRGRPRHMGVQDFEHSAYVLLIDKRGRQRVGFPFEELDADVLAQDMRILAAEPG